MFNTILICLFILFVIYVCIYLKKKRHFKFFDDKKSILEILSYLCVILALVYGFYTYTFNIYPVFEKEDRLKNTQNELVITQKNLDKEKIKLNDFIKKSSEQKVVIDNYKLEISEKESEIDNLQKEISLKTLEKANLESKVSKLDDKIKEVESEAVFSYLLKDMNNIMRDAIDYNAWNKDKRYSLKEETLKVANDGLQCAEKGSYEYKAFLILKQYAEEKLTYSSYNAEDIIKVIDFYYQTQLSHTNP